MIVDLSKETFVELKSFGKLSLYLPDRLEKLMKDGTRLLDMLLGCETILNRGQERLRRICSSTCTSVFRGWGRDEELLRREMSTSVKEFMTIREPVLLYQDLETTDSTIERVKA